MSDDKVRDALTDDQYEMFKDHICVTLGGHPGKRGLCRRVADTVLADLSDVLATVRADAQREVVDAVEAVMPSKYNESAGVLIRPSDLRNALAPFAWGSA